MTVTLQNLDRRLDTREHYSIAVNIEDQDLICQCLAGQTEAFGQLVVRYQNRLYHTLLSMLGSSDDARDVAQESFVLAFQKLSSFRGDSAFYSWLFRIAVNASVSYRRKNRRVMASIDQAREVSGTEPADGRFDTAPSHTLESKENQQVVRDALAELSEEYRTALVLKEIEGMKYEEIAHTIGCPIGTVRSRIHRARAELRDKLQLMLKAEQ